MSNEVKKLKSILIDIDGDNSEVFTKLSKDLKDKLRDKYDQDKVAYSLRGKNGIILKATDTATLLDAFSIVEEHLKRIKIKWTITAGCFFDIFIEDSDVDAFDFVTKYVTLDIHNLNTIITFSNRSVVIYNDIDYLVDIDVRAINNLNILIQKEVKTTDLCSIFEEFTSLYYDTFHIALNKEV